MGFVIMYDETHMRYRIAVEVEVDAAEMLREGVPLDCVGWSTDDWSWVLENWDEISLFRVEKLRLAGELDEIIEAADG